VMDALAGGAAGALAGGAPARSRRVPTKRRSRPPMADGSRATLDLPFRDRRPGADTDLGVCAG
jgi:hypothetical protein